MKTFLLVVLVAFLKNASGKAIMKRQLGTLENCPSGWKKWGENCYKYFSHQVTWTDARAICVNQSAELASIHSAGEGSFAEAFLPSNGDGYMWIGLTDEGSESTWSWSDGTILDYKKWDNGQPNGGHSENCVSVNRSNKLWWDRACDSKNDFICKRTFPKYLVFNCSFEKDFCGFEQGGPYNWNRHSGSTSTSGTGPSSAFDGRYYAYIEASSMSQTNGKATLISPVLIGSICDTEIRFKYNMYGSYVRKLVVRLLFNKTTEITVFEKSGNQGSLWQDATVVVPGNRGDYKIAFDGYGYRSRYYSNYFGYRYHDEGDIAVDNIEILRILTHNCPVLTCPDPPHVPYSQMMFRKHQLDSSVTYTCNAGLMFKGTSVSTKFYRCNVFDGTWESDFNILVCEAQCPSSYNGSGKEGVIISPGYPHQYTNNADCSWIIKGVPNHKLTLKFDFFETELEYDKLEISEYPSGQLLGHLSLHAPATILTYAEQLRLRWTTDRSKQGKGFQLRWKTSMCPEITKPMNGYFNYTGLEKGDIVEFTCQPGYKLSGPNMGVCTANGWTHQSVPKCTIKSCRSLTSPANGQLYGSNFYYGSRVQYQCNRGYITVGEQYRTCLENATWSGIDTYCQIADCGPLAKPSFGKKFGNKTVYQSTLDFTCQYGKASGDLRRVCQADGRWSGSVTRCVDPFQCNFEYGYCGYNQVNWNRQSGILVKGQNISNGYYAYVRGYYFRGSPAKLTSQKFLPTTTCYTLKFSYFITGNSTRALRVYMQERQIFLKEHSKILFDQGKDTHGWGKATIEIDTNRFAFTSIVFEVQRENNPQQTVAIDDVKLVDHCLSRTTLPPTTTEKTAITAIGDVSITPTLETAQPEITTPILTANVTGLTTNAMRNGSTNVNTDCSISQRHFELEVASNTLQKVTSPRYGQYINETCSWLFRAKDDTGQLDLIFTEFDLSPRENGTCKEYVELTSSSIAGLKVIKTLCGNEGVHQKSSILVDKPTSITIHLVLGDSYDNHSYKGFVAEISNQSTQ